MNVYICCSCWYTVCIPTMSWLFVDCFNHSLWAVYICLILSITTCIDTHTHTCMYIYIGIPKLDCLIIWLCTYICIWGLSFAYTYMFMFPFMYIHLFVCAHVCLHMSLYINVLAYLFMYIWNLVEVETAYFFWGQCIIRSHCWSATRTPHDTTSITTMVNHGHHYSCRHSWSHVHMQFQSLYARECTIRHICGIFLYGPSVYMYIDANAWTNTHTHTFIHIKYISLHANMTTNTLQTMLGLTLVYHHGNSM